MRRPFLCLLLTFFAVSFLDNNRLQAQSLEFRWQQSFPKSVSWYVRTSPGILLVHSGNSLIALEGLDGHELWSIPEIHFPLAPYPRDNPISVWRNLVEVPGKGVLLLNNVRLNGEKDAHLIGVNLATGEKLWQQPPLEHLLGSALPIPGTSEALLVAYHFDRLLAAGQAAASGGYLNLGPFRFVLQRMDLATGKVRWNAEYPYVFNWGANNIQIFGNAAILNYSNSVVGAVDLSNGKPSWKDGLSLFGGSPRDLPPVYSQGHVIYALKELLAVDPVDDKAAWVVDDLGKITGIIAHNQSLYALGSRSLASLDPKTGNSLWRKSTRPDSTNLLFDSATNSLIFADYKSLTRVDAATGKSLLDVRLRDACEDPKYIRPAGSEAVVAFGKDTVCVFSLSNGKLLYTGAKPIGFFRSYSFVNIFALTPSEPELIYRAPQVATIEAWNAAKQGSFLPASYLDRLKDFPQADDGSADAYELSAGPGSASIWWIDPQTQQLVVIHPTGKDHDVARFLGLVFAVSGNNLWAATIKRK